MTNKPLLWAVVVVAVLAASAVVVTPAVSNLDAAQSAVQVEPYDTPETEVRLDPTDVSVETGEKVTFDVVVTDATFGVSAYDVRVSVDGGVARVSNSEFRGDPRLTDRPTLVADAVTLRAAGADTADSGSVVVATVTVQAFQKGETDVSVNVDTLGNEDERSYEVTATSGTTVSASGDLIPNLIPEVDVPNIVGGGTGDPHFVTFDGVAYDYQAAGEYVVAREDGGPFEVQARQEPLDGRQVTVFTAVATRVGDGTVTVDVRDDEPLTVNGSRVPTSGTGRVVVGGGYVAYDRGAGTFRVVYPGENGRVDDGDAQLVVDTFGDRLDLRLNVGPDRGDDLVGLLGTANGDPGDDIAYANGTNLDRPPTFGQLYGPFRADWRVTDADSLFTYEDGNGPNSYYREDFPTEVVTVDDLDPAVREEAERTAREAGLEPGTAAFRNAVLDFGLTGDPSYIDSADRSVEADPDQGEEVVVPDPPENDTPTDPAVFPDPVSLPGFENVTPTDPDGDGLFEDVDGNGTVDVRDRRALDRILASHVRAGRRGLDPGESNGRVERLTDAQVDALDFNDDGRFDRRDVVTFGRGNSNSVDDG